MLEKISQKSTKNLSLGKKNLSEDEETNMYTANILSAEITAECLQTKSKDN